MVKSPLMANPQRLFLGNVGLDLDKENGAQNLSEGQAGLPSEADHLSSGCFPLVTTNVFLGMTNFKIQKTSY